MTTEGMVWEEKPSTPLEVHHFASTVRMCWDQPEDSVPATTIGLPPVFAETVMRHEDEKKWQKCESTVALNRQG